MDAVLHYERIAPAERCVSPDGHDYIECMTFASRVPEEIVCPRCGALWTVVVFGDGA